MTGTTAEESAAHYNRAEAAYLDAVRQSRYSELAKAARTVSDAAKAWESAAYAKYFQTKNDHGESSGEAVLDEIEAEKAEVLAELWQDIAEAHQTAAARP